MLLFSATGLTWSQWAGGNVDKMRAAFGWLTPQVNTQLHSAMPMPHDPHAEHHMGHRADAAPAAKGEQFDRVLTIARAAGLAASKLEIGRGRSMKLTEAGPRRWMLWRLMGRPCRLSIAPALSISR